MQHIVVVLIIALACVGQSRRVHENAKYDANDGLSDLATLLLARTPPAAMRSHSKPAISPINLNPLAVSAGNLITAFSLMPKPAWADVVAEAAQAACGERCDPLNLEASVLLFSSIFVVTPLWFITNRGYGNFSEKLTEANKLADDEAIEKVAQEVLNGLPGMLDMTKQEVVTGLRKALEQDGEGDGLYNAIQGEPQDPAIQVAYDPEAKKVVFMTQKQAQEAWKKEEEGEEDPSDFEAAIPILSEQAFEEFVTGQTNVQGEDLDMTIDELEMEMKRIVENMSEADKLEKNIKLAYDRSTKKLVGLDQAGVFFDKPTELVEELDALDTKYGLDSSVQTITGDYNDRLGAAFKTMLKRAKAEKEKLTK